MITLTRQQRVALHRKWCQDSQGRSYKEFRKINVEPSFDDCIMVHWCGMWLGIETDGYTHS